MKDHGRPVSRRAGERRPRRDLGSNIELHPLGFASCKYITIYVNLFPILGFHLNSVTRNELK